MGGGGGWLDGEHLGAEGHAGGVLVLWDRRMFTKMGSFLWRCSVSCLLQVVENDKLWLYSGVYGPCDDAARCVLWEDLKSVKMRWNVPWCMGGGGDFNVVHFPYERSSSRSYSRAMADFNDFINEMGLVDLPLVGGDFTWFRNSDSRQFSRIDRFLVTIDCEELFNGSVQSCLPRVTSDHVPLLLESGGCDRGKSPFRFKNMWLKEPGFVDWVRGKWLSYEPAGNPCFRLARKLKKKLISNNYIRIVKAGDESLYTGSILQKISYTTTTCSLYQQKNSQSS